MKGLNAIFFDSNALEQRAFTIKIRLAFFKALLLRLEITVAFLSFETKQ